MLVVYWKSGDEKGHCGFYPSEWFQEEGKWSKRRHYVQNPRKALEPAICSVDVHNKIIADLDYGAEHAAINRERRFDIGTIRIVFATPAREEVEDVQWREESGTEFTPIDVEVFHADLPLEGLDPFDPANLKDGRKKIQRLVRLRQGQREFREKLLTAYDERCAVTGCTIPELLEAAHISPYLGEHTNHVTNGLLLRADIHTLFDCGLLKISKDYRITATDSVKAAYDLPASITLPSDSLHHPSPEALSKKWA